MKFGEHLKEARLTKNATQDKVASDLFVTRQTISNWENEKAYPDIAMLIKLSDYYQISLDTLLKEDTGMRENLEKQDVIKELKPIHSFLTLAQLALLIFWICDLYGLFNLHLWAVLPFLITIFLLKALIKLDNFDKENTLGLQYKWQKYLDQHKKLDKIISGIMIILLFGIFVLKDQGILTGYYSLGVISGIILGCLILFIIFIKNK